jgi:hypothetical protein
MSKHPSHILELAKRGAEHRYQELKSELALLVRLFPHLRGGSASGLGSAAETVTSPVRRRRPKMSAAARKAIGRRMKKLWAARRKAKKA